VRVRFLADADLNKAIVSGVLRREPSIDFLTAQAAGLRKMKDLEVLALAAGQQRVLVSHDVGTMPMHFRAFKSAGNSSPGVFLAAQTLDIGTAIEELLLVWLASKASEWETGCSGCRFENSSEPCQPPVCMANYYIGLNTAAVEVLIRLAGCAMSPF